MTNGPNTGIAYQIFYFILGNLQCLHQRLKATVFSNFSNRAVSKGYFETTLVYDDVIWKRIIYFFSLHSFYKWLVLQWIFDEKSSCAKFFSEVKSVKKYSKKIWVIILVWTHTLTSLQLVHDHILPKLIWTLSKKNCKIMFENLKHT